MSGAPGPAAGRSELSRRRALTQRLLQPGALHRFQQVVHGVHLERLDRVLVEGRHEHQGRGVVLAREQAPGHFEPAQPRHLDVEEDEVGLVAIDGGQGLQAVARLRHDLDVADLLELIAELLPRELLVVHDHHSSD